MNMEALRFEIEEYGMPIATLAERSGVPRATIYYRLEHPETWRVDEMMAVSKTLKMTRAKQVEIFDLKL